MAMKYTNEICVGKKNGVSSVAKMALAAGLSLALVSGLSGCVVGSAQASDDGKQKGQETRSEQSSSQESTVGTPLEDLDLSFSKRDLDYSYDEATATKVQLSDAGITVEGDGATADSGTLTLSAAGTYLLSGSISDGEVVVNVGDEDKLQVVLDGVSIVNAHGPAFFVDNADKVFVTLAEGSQNSLSDGASYDLDGDDDNRDATVFSRDDLAINGTGSLDVKGNFSHGIVSKNDLIIAGPSLTVTAKEDAMQGDDCVKVAEGAITVNASDDGIKSDTVVYVKDGIIDVQTCVEGYEAEKIIIDGGTHTVLASDDALNAALASDNTTTTGNAMGGMPSGNQPTSNSTTTAVSFAQDDSSGSEAQFGQKGNGMQRGKGMRDGSNMPDDSMPDGETPSDGTMRDFGNGMQGGRMGGFGGGGGMAPSSEYCLIQINGGTLTLSGGADAIDSNGNVEINGGVVLVCGPNSGMDGSLDYDLSAQVNGGTVLMTGSVGSAKGLDQSEQAWTLASVQGAKGSNVALLDADGNELASLTATQAFANVFASSPQIANGSSFAIVVDGNPTTLTMK